jgi:hypothetical protein
MAVSIASGIFKTLSYAKEFELGKVQDTAGEGLTSPASIAVSTGIAQGDNLALGTNLTVTGLLAIGQLFQIGSDKYKVSAVTQNTSGNTTTATIVSLIAGDAKALNNYSAGVKVTLLASTEEFPITTASTPAIGQAPTAATTGATGTGTAGLSTLAIGGFTAGIIPVGQRLSIGGNAYIVTASVATGVVTTSVTVFPVLVTSPSSGAITFVTSITGKYLRRVSSNMNLKLQTFKSNEIRTDMQRADLAVGGRTVDGTISGELSNKTYADFIGSTLRRDFTTGATASSVAITAATATKDTPRLTLVTSTDTTATLKVGDVIYTSAWGNTTLNAFNNYNFIVIENTATKIVLDLLKDNFSANIALTGLAISPSFVVKGKKTYIPKSNHTKDSYAIEHWYSDIGESQLFLGCRPTQLAIKLSPSAMSTIDITVMGTASKSAQIQQLANPTASGTDTTISATTGALYIKNKKGTSAVLEKVGLLTSFDITVNGNGSNASVIGSDQTPDIFLGSLDVTGNSSIYFLDGKYRDAFLNQDEVSIIAVFRADGDANGQFISLVLPKVKFSDASVNDGESGLLLTMPFTATLYSVAIGSTNFEETTVQIQDSAL